MIAYPIWNKLNHGPATTAVEIENEEQRPLVWIVANSDEELSEKLETVLSGLITVR